MEKLLTNHTDGMEKVVCRAIAKVPIVKCWDPVLKLACDINVNNPLALENTRMIRTYVQLDDRVRPLAKIIKYWTKRRLLNDAGKIAPFCATGNSANLVNSVRWHDQLLHLDMYDHQLSSKTKSAYPPFSAEDARR